MQFSIQAACWHHYPPETLGELMADHPILFPKHTLPDGPVRIVYEPWQTAGKPYTDPWGCVWKTTDDGITGTVIEHPLSTWDDFDGYHFPDPAEFGGKEKIDWRKTAKELTQARKEGGLAKGSLEHGHTFLRLLNLRGYENLILDMADGESRLRELIAAVEEFNLGIVNRYLEIGVDWMSYPEDLGMQVGPMLSPDQFRRYIKPSYRRLMAPARESGCIVHMHSDGDIRELVNDLIDGGVEVVNLQDLVNGLDWIAGRLRGKICIELDIDRQRVTRFGSPKEIDELIRREVVTLGSPEGGLMLVYGLYPGVPLENVRAVMGAMERYAGHFS